MVLIKDNAGRPLYHYDTMRGIHYDLKGNRITQEKSEMTTYESLSGPKKPIYRDLSFEIKFKICWISFFIGWLSVVFIGILYVILR